MGVSNLEARILSRETSSEKIPEFLRLEPECRRSQLHLPPISERDDRPELDRRNPRPFPFHHQSASGSNPHQAPEERGRIPATLSRHAGSFRACKAPRPGALSTPAKLQSRSGGARRVSRNSAAKCARGIRIPPRILADRRH